MDFIWSGLFSKKPSMWLQPMRWYIVVPPKLFSLERADTFCLVLSCNYCPGKKQDLLWNFEVYRAENSVLKNAWIALHSVNLHPFSSGCAYKLVCYVTNWAQYREGAARFTPQEIDPFLCTHLLYAFAGITNNQIVTTDRNDKMLYRELNALKKRQVIFNTECILLMMFNRDCYQRLAFWWQQQTQSEGASLNLITHSYFKDYA